MASVYATFTALLLWGVWGVLSKVSAGAGRPPSQVLIFETIGHVAGVLLTIAVFGPGEFKLGARSMIAPILTGFFGAVAMLLFIYALRDGKASVVVPVTALYPAVTVVLAYMFLHESFDARTLAGLFFAIVAALLLSR